MRTNCIKRFGIAVLSVLVLASMPGCPPGAIVVINDEILEAAIREEVSKPLGFLTVGDMLLIRNLDINDLGIQDLSGLEFCANMKFLDASGNPVSDISPIANLINLTSLNLDDTEIFETSALAGLLNLESLSLCGTPLTDIQPLVTNSMNGGLGLGDFVNLPCGTLGDQADAIDIPALQAAGVNVICCDGGSGTVDEPALLVAMTSNLAIGNVTQGSAPTVLFQISNSGDGTLVWGIPTDALPSWITLINPSSGTEAEGAVATNVNVSVDSTGLPLGAISTDIDVFSNGGNELGITISMNVVAP